MKFDQVIIPRAFLHTYNYILNYKYCELHHSGDAIDVCVCLGREPGVDVEAKRLGNTTLGDI